jgi:hypothetical protein
MAETSTGPMGNRVGIRRGTGANRKEGACHSLLASVPRPIPTLFPIGPVKVSVLADWFLYLEPIPRVRLTHRPNDRGSKDL